MPKNMYAVKHEGTGFKKNNLWNKANMIANIGSFVHIFCIHVDPVV
jgi:hypothetical protein